MHHVAARFKYTQGGCRRDRRHGLRLASLFILDDEIRLTPLDEASDIEGSGSCMLGEDVVVLEARTEAAHD